MYNAALSGEQRRPLHLTYCAVNTKAEANQKCQALGIRLKRFVKLHYTCDTSYETYNLQDYNEQQRSIIESAICAAAPTVDSDKAGPPSPDTQFLYICMD
ncbi:hypothetical protein FVP01_24545 [Vibrio parahaemolyticus]|uniref:Uncharacterized protein n=1 Tax=Vibrio parahaemolyticus TaxID=670 RepID=A0AA46L1P2_VIBPH|nr:hypothetical protein FVP01_24545 [Vibrio parahaemolyticus]